MSQQPIIQIGIAPFRIDFIAALRGVTFVEVAADAPVARVDGLDLRVISLTNLLRNRRSTGRSKDKADVRRLEKLSERR